MSEQHSCMRLDVLIANGKLQDPSVGNDPTSPAMVSVRRAVVISGSRYTDMIIKCHAIWHGHLAIYNSMRQFVCWHLSMPWQRLYIICSHLSISLSTHLSSCHHIPNFFPLPVMWPNRSFSGIYVKLSLSLLWSKHLDTTCGSHFLKMYLNNWKILPMLELNFFFFFSSGRVCWHKWCCLIKHFYI